MTNQFEKGDIIQGSKRRKNEAYHPIIYFEEIDEIYFKGGMITHSENFGNIKLEISHFEQKIDNNPKASYFVNKPLIKKQEWEPFILIGKLSKSGIEFIEKNLKNKNSETWENYLDTN